MNANGRATRWPRLANPVLAALRKPAVIGLSAVTMDLQAVQAVNGLREGRLTMFEGRVLEALVFITRKLAEQGIGPEALQCCERCQVLLTVLKAGRTLQPDQVQAFDDLIGWNQAQRDADTEAYVAAALPFIR